MEYQVAYSYTIDVRKMYSEIILTVFNIEAKRNGKIYIMQCYQYNNNSVLSNNDKQPVFNPCTNKQMRHHNKN